MKTTESGLIDIETANGEGVFIHVRECRDGYELAYRLNDLQECIKKKDPIAEPNGWFSQILKTIDPGVDHAETERAWKDFSEKFGQRFKDFVYEIVMSTTEVILYPAQVLEVHINDRVFILEGDDILKPSKFEAFWHYNFNYPLKLSKQDWFDIMSCWLDRAEVMEADPAVVPVANAINDVLNYIHTTMIHGREEKDVRSRRVFPWADGDAILLHRGVIEDICRRNNVSVRAWSAYARPYLVGPSIQRRVEGEKARFWRFDPIAVGVSLQTKIDS
jgi:hypothetical protein